MTTPPARLTTRGSLLARSRAFWTSGVAATTVVLALAGCAGHADDLATFPSVAVRAPEGRAIDLEEVSRRAPATVIFFFARHCPCQAAHDARLRELHERFAAQGVAFFGVASEVDETDDSVAAEAKARSYPFPLLRDPGARLADAVGARYATYTIVLDRAGRIRYRGGIDSDRSHLAPDASPYVAWAIEDLLNGRALRRAQAEVLGCALERS